MTDRVAPCARNTGRIPAYTPHMPLIEHEVVDYIASLSPADCDALLIKVFAARGAASSEAVNSLWGDFDC